MTKKLSLLLLSVVLLYFNWTYWYWTIVGLLSLILYYSISTVSWGAVVERALALNRVWSRIFGWLVGFYLSIFAISIPVVIWKYNRLAVALVMFAVGLVGLVLSLRVKRSGAKQSDSRDKNEISENNIQRTGQIASALGLAMTFKNWHFILLGLLSAVFVFLLFISRTGEYILSPWDSLPTVILIVFFGLMWLVASLVFSNQPIKIVLLVIVLFSFLAHLYLPVVYKTSFSGDKWRHLAIERYLQTGQAYTPSIWGDKIRPMVNFGPVAVPEALVAGNKTSYAGQWAITIMLAESLGADVFKVDWWLVFCLWSFFIPLLFFQFGKLFFTSERLGLLFAILPSIFYTFQVDGAITLPVTLSYIFFFFVLLLWIDYARRGQKSTFCLASGLTLFFYWGYILHLFVLLAIGFLAYVWRARPKKIFWISAGAGILFLPFLELIGGLSFFSLKNLSWAALINGAANGLGLITAFIGRTAVLDVLEQGNFLYHQTSASLSNLSLFSFQAVPFGASVIVWFAALWAVYRAWRARQGIDNFLAWLFFIFLLAYLVDFIATTGLHLLVRRLDALLALFLIIFFGLALWKFLTSDRVPILPRKRILAVVFLLSFMATSTFASGPKLAILPADDQKAATVVWEELAANADEHYCVIAESWPLLVLEAQSRRKVIGGGFPMLPEYQQPDLTNIFNGLMKEPRREWLEIAFRVTKADTCYYLNKKRLLSEPVFQQTISLFGEPVRAGEMYIWKIDNFLTRMTFSHQMLYNTQ
ncbi:MAG: hypothetical protein Q8L21_01105 [Candidatus Komeilibacteria bacterium]|nr:hypothetical protein [Candidatus Komeilibacteria bacterium]